MLNVSSYLTENTFHVHQEDYSLRDIYSENHTERTNTYVDKIQTSLLLNGTYSYQPFIEG